MVATAASRSVFNPRPPDAFHARRWWIQREASCTDGDYLGRFGTHTHTHSLTHSLTHTQRTLQPTQRQGRPTCIAIDEKSYSGRSSRRQLSWPALRGKDFDVIVVLGRSYSYDCTRQEFGAAVDPLLFRRRLQRPVFCHFFAVDTRPCTPNISQANVALVEAVADQETPDEWSSNVGKTN